MSEAEPDRSHRSPQTPHKSRDTLPLPLGWSSISLWPSLLSSWNASPPRARFQPQSRSSGSSPLPRSSTCSVSPSPNPPQPSPRPRQPTPPPAPDPASQCQRLQYRTGPKLSVRCALTTSGRSMSTFDLSARGGVGADSSSGGRGTAMGSCQGPDACDEHGRCYGGELLKVSCWR